MSAHWETVEHTADLALRIYGRDLSDLFANAALAMFEQLDPGVVQQDKPSVERRVCVEGDDCESLLVNWMNELLYLHEAQREAYSQFEIQALECELASRAGSEPDHPAPPDAPGVSSGALSAVVRGAPSVHPERLIKAATFHELRIESNPPGLAVTVVLDV